MFAAIAILALLASIALTVDVGRMYAAKRNLQTQANMAALDASRVVARCTSWGAPGHAEVEAEARASLLRNRFDTDANANLSVEIGRVITDPATSMRRLVPSAQDEADGVRVTLARPLPSRLLGTAPSPERLMRASATAQQEAVASFFVGTEIAGLDGGLLNGLLGTLLCAPGDTTCQQNVIGLNVANNATGLLSVGVSLGQLGVALGIDVKDLSDPLALSGQTPLLSELLDGLVGVLGDTVSHAVSGLLRGVGQAVGGNPARVPIGDMLDTVTDTGMDAPIINLLDLLLALGQAATPAGTTVPVALPVSLNIPEVTALHAFVEILAPPKLSGFGRAGEATATSSAISLKVRLEVDAVSNLLQVLRSVLSILDWIVKIDLSITPLKLGVDIDVAQAVARLERLQCPRYGVDGGNPTVEMSATPSVASVNLGTFQGSALNAPPIDVGASQLLGLNAKVDLLHFIPLLDLSVNLHLDNPGPLETRDQRAVMLPHPITEFSRVALESVVDPVISLPYYWLANNPDSLANPQTVGARNVLQHTISDLFALLDIRASDPSGGNRNTQLCVLGICIPLGEVLDAILVPVIQLLGAVLTGVGGLVDVILDPLLELLGVRLSSATVTVSAVSVEPPRIVSTELPPTLLQ